MHGCPGFIILDPSGSIVSTNGRDCLLTFQSKVSPNQTSSNSSASQHPDSTSSIPAQPESTPETKETQLSQQATTENRKDMNSPRDGKDQLTKALKAIAFGPTSPSILSPSTASVAVAPASV